MSVAVASNGSEHTASARVVRGWAANASADAWVVREWAAVAAASDVCDASGWLGMAVCWSVAAVAASDVCGASGRLYVAAC